MPSTKATSDNPQRSLSAPSSTSSVAKENDVTPKNISGILALKDQELSRNLSLEAQEIVHSEDKDDPQSKFDLAEKDQIPNVDDDIPDGGLAAWLVVFGGMCNTYCTFGYVNSWGIFQAYYQETFLKDQSPSAIAWIGSLQYALIFFPALIVGRLFDIGHYRILFRSTSALLVLTTFLTAECKEYWQFLLCQGFAAGLACGGIFGCCNAIIAHWFKKRRGLAMGLVAIGSSIGGTTLPIAVKQLIPRVGFQWTMRIIGFLLLGVIGVCNLTMRRRLPPINVKGGLLNPAAFKNASYTIYCFSSLIIFLGLYTMLTYVSVSAESLGSSADISFYFVSIANAASCFGRWSAGLLADRIGPMNVIIPTTLVAGILTYAWPFATSTAPLIVVTIFYGFFSGTYVALLTNPIMDFGGEGDVGRRVGMYMSITALGAVAGPPISGAINAKTGGFQAVGFYAGSMVILGVLLMILARYLTLRGWLGKM